MIHPLRISLIGLLVVGWLGLPRVAVSEPAKNRPNVLLITVDDLRPQLGCYGQAEMITPHLDRLAGDSRLFTRHYVQVATCHASRFSMLTSQRPLTRQDFAGNTFAKLYRPEGTQWISLPERFRQSGYRTVSIGKITHSPDGHRRGSSITGRGGDGQVELPRAWDLVYTPTGQWETAWGAFFAYSGGRSRVIGKTPSTEAADVPDEGYPDGLIAQEAISQLRKLQLRNLKGEPFFLAVGFYKPHLPFCAPKKYWDLYRREEIPPAKNPHPPKNIDATISLHSSGELTPRYSGLATAKVITSEEARKLRHGYYACVSYVDAQIGKVLGELEDLGLRDNTIVVVWGDHGWHLGDQGLWGKHTNMERALRSVLIMKTPGLKHPGQAATGLVESVDIYPTLCDLAGLKTPENLAGKSIAPLLKDPHHLGKDAALGYWRRGRYFGRTLRSDRYRLTEWTEKTASDDQEKTVQIELYDLDKDPEETVNIAQQSPETVDKLLKQLQKQSPQLLQ